MLDDDIPSTVGFLGTMLVLVMAWAVNEGDLCS